MKCKTCQKTFKFGPKSIRLYFFDKTLHFCSKKCYGLFFVGHELSYWQWLRRYSKLTPEQKKKYQKNLLKVESQIKKNNERYDDLTKALKAKNDMIWSKPAKPLHLFEHVSKYNSFKDFKQGVIKFLYKDTLKSLDSFDFCLMNQYSKKKQEEQTDAINRIFDELYGKDKVKWKFISFSIKNDLEGVYLEIEGNDIPLDYSYEHTLNAFIKRKIKGRH